MKIKWKIILSIWCFANFQETFLDQSIWKCKWASWWCHRLTIFHSFCSTKKKHFSYENVRLAFNNSSLNRCRIMLPPIYPDTWGICYHKFGQNIKIFKIVCTKYMASSEAMTSSTYSFANSYRYFQKCFVKIAKL